MYKRHLLVPNALGHSVSRTVVVLLGWLGARQKHLKKYGVILNHFQKQDPSVTESIRGCIVDSAPVAHPDAQVWASGFSAALLMKNSVATKGRVLAKESGIKVSIGCV
ncbi:hypothetical protein Fmac_005714 [Flemingia macrophylla]|uniref:Uncharacterized protein n=1 Tax=Flemingia macrophylla TaxID=520843 RepID=A0ABD1N8P0_9FABA